MLLAFDYYLKMSPSGASRMDGLALVTGHDGHVPETIVTPLLHDDTSSS